MSSFTADGRLDVNGMVANGIEEIRAMYELAGSGGGEEEPKPVNAITA